MSWMRSANVSNQSTDRRVEYSTENQEAVRPGLRILARMIARAHLRHQASRSLPAPKPPIQGEDGG